MLLTFCLLLLVAPVSGVCGCSVFCCALLYVHSSIAIILIGKRVLVALLNLSSWCIVMVERLFLAVSWGCLRFVIVVFPDHTHLLFVEGQTSHAHYKYGGRLRPKFGPLVSLVTSWYTGICHKDQKAHALANTMCHFLFLLVMKRNYQHCWTYPKSQFVLSK